MKGITKYFLVFAVLLVVSGILYLSGKQGSLKKSDRDFAVEDTSRVYGIEIRNGAEIVRIFREGSLWKLNDEYLVRKDRIRGFLYLLSKIDVHSPVSNALNKQIADALLNTGSQVSIVMNSGKEKNYRVYYDSVYSGASYMMMNHSNLPFRIQLPGYGFSNLCALFQTEPHYWRDNTLLAIPAGNILSLSLQYFDRPASSFIIEKNKEGHFSFSDLDGKRGDLSPDPAKLSGYLARYASVSFEEFITVPDRGERIDPPLAELKIADNEGTVKDIVFFEKYLTDESGRIRKDPDRLFALMQNDGEWVVVKYMEIDPLLKEAQYFSME